MNETTVVYTAATDSEQAARDLCRQIFEQLPGEPCDVIVLFASPQYDQKLLLEVLHASCKPKILMGASSAGEFTRDAQGEGLACALAIRSDEMQFALGVGRDLARDRVAAAKQIASSFQGVDPEGYPYRAALVLTDALAGHADDLVDQLTVATAGRYQFFGGGAGDDAHFRRTQVFYGREALTDAAVALEMLSKKPIGIGVGHGWQPASAPMRVTEASGMNLVSINGFPAVEAFEQHAQATDQTFDRNAPLPFFLHNVVGIETGEGHRLRVPLQVLDDGSVACAAEIPIGAKICIMGTDVHSHIEAASRAAASALDALGPHKAKTALFFDCVATRLRMGGAFGSELAAMTDTLGPLAEFIGCNTQGQIARADGQFGGFHNCTAVVCVLPE